MGSVALTVSSRAVFTSLLAQIGEIAQACRGERELALWVIHFIDYQSGLGQGPTHSKDFVKGRNGAPGLKFTFGHAVSIHVYRRGLALTLSHLFASKLHMSSHFCCSSRVSCIIGHSE